MPNNHHPPLNAIQLDALRAYRKVHGRYWKSRLNLDWLNGRYSGIDNGSDVAAVLQGLRNTHGPAWLLDFKMPRED